MKAFDRKIFVALTVLLSFAWSIAPGTASAQQRYPIEEKPEWSTGKYIQQHAIDVGDVPGHKVRILELHYIYNDPKTGYNRSESKGEYWFEE